MDIAGALLGVRLRVPWRRIRVLWAAGGTLALVTFTTWMALAYRASDTAIAAHAGDAFVEVVAGPDADNYRPRRGERSRARLLFIPGALVDPAAYAPLARVIASVGYRVTVIRQPLRGAFGAGEDGRELQRTAAAAGGTLASGCWVLAGHSRGAAVAARVARASPAGVVALVVMGSRHPVEFSLASFAGEVVRISADRDGLATPERLAATRANLPAGAREVVIAGGNHSQFGYYGFQPGDRPAIIERDEQTAIVAAELIATLARASAHDPACR